MTLRLALLPIALVAVSAAAQSSQPASASCLTKAAELKEKVAELNSPDSLRRLAMFNEMLVSCDPAQREIAYERGFASSEQTVRALTLRAKLRDARTLMLEVAAPKDADDGAHKAVKSLGGYVDMPVTSYDADKGDLKLGAYSSRVSGTTIQLAYGACKGVLQLGEAGVLAGTVSCWNSPLTGTIRL